MTTSDKVRILVVDDLPEKHLVYRVILEELGEEIVSALSGADALRKVLEHDFAVILLDVNMPDMDGFETASLIRQRKRSAHTPIIFVTAFADEMRATEGYAHGAVDYILAPIVPEILRAKVKVFVDLFRMTEHVKRRAEEQVLLAEERSRRAAAEDANRRLGFLARAGAVVAQSLDYRVTIRSSAKLAVPLLADEALLVTAQGPEGISAVRARGEGDDAFVEDVSGPEVCDFQVAAAVADVLASGAPAFLPADFDVGAAGPRIMVLPLRARGQTLAALALSREPSQRRFSSADLTMAEALASRAAMALENARLYRDLEQADRQKDEFLSMLAHELRNPLAPICAAVAVLRRRLTNDPDAHRAQDVIDRQVTHLVRLVDDLLDVSRITRGKIQLKRETLDAASVVATAVEISHPNIEAHSHRLEVRLPEEPLHVEADHARLAQVLANLLNNAAKFTPLRGWIRISVQREGDQAVFRVRDNGVGIPPEMISKVFELFTQVDRSLDRSQGGLGVGLTLVKRLVEAHGGCVEAASDGAGRGSEFTVRLPAVNVATAPAALGAEPASEPALAPSRVLVVDDNVDAADSLAWLLRLSGHETYIEYSGPAAVEAARRCRPQLVVLDLGLPGLDGFAVARRLRQDPATRDAVLVAVSGYGRPEDFQRSSEAGFDHHFVKPVDVSSLLELLSAAIPDCDSPAGVAP